MTSEAGQTPRRLIAWTGTLALASMLFGGEPAFGQDEDSELAGPVDPCATNPCRGLSRDDRAAFGRLLAKMMDAMPTPDKLRYKQTALKSVEGLGESIVGDEARQSPMFPANIIDTMGLAYPAGTFPRSLAVAALFIRTEGGGEKAHSSGSGELEIFDLRVHISAHAAPVFYSSEVSGRMIESKGVIQIWERPLPAEEQGMAHVKMVVGQTTHKRDAALGTGLQPPDVLAPLQAIQVEVFGPKNEVLALTKKADTKALLALLTPAARKPKARPAPKKESN